MLQLFSLTHGFVHNGASLQRDKTPRVDKLNRTRQDEVPAAVDEAWHVTSLRPKLVYGILLLDGTNTLRDVPQLAHAHEMVHSRLRSKTLATRR